MTVWEIIKDALLNFTATDWVLLGALILIPLITIVLVIVAIVNGRKRKVAEPVAEAAVEAPAEAEEKAEEPKPKKIRYITTNAPERTRVRVRVKNLCKVDQSLLVATGIFGVGLGLMIQKAVNDEFRC
ncbi:MAG: hypothetical protein E7620_03490 [Ruminococcaceae bacterium]|nr:hypothetical protein [Oscillospiraceae bacterium]